MILLGGCPLVWKSRLQTETALSTLEAEYSGLSAAMRVLLPTRRLLQEVISTLTTIPPTIVATFHCRIFEDNNGALILALTQRPTSHTKYFHVKWHHFWESINTKEVEINKIATGDQLADYLTKGLSRFLFESNRKSLQGY
jgi:hypothetical protein